jgi:16S rRNA G966 N2-methylase RsmD
VAALPGGFDIVFLDPPYGDPLHARWVDVGAGQVAPGGLLIVEHDRKRTLAARAGELARARELASGDSALSFYRHPA